MKDRKGYYDELRSVFRWRSIGAVQAHEWSALPQSHKPLKPLQITPHQRMTRKFPQHRAWTN